MRAGEFPDGARTLRAKIDMASPNMLLRDPVMYRILHAHHHRQGDKWCIYPTYDWAHGLEDSIEGVTHSLCSQEYEIHRPLYDWFLDELGIYHPRQIEFAAAEPDPHRAEQAPLHRAGERRPRRRLRRPAHARPSPACAAAATPPRRSASSAAASASPKSDSRVDVAFLEDCVREDLNRRSPRAMAVLDPLKVVLINYPEGQTEELDVVNNPEDPAAGTRKVPFARELYIERDDFREEPPPKFFRLAPGREVRLRNAYLIRCEEVVKDADGDVTELRCTYDPADPRRRCARRPQGEGHPALGRRPARAVPAEIRLYDHLFVKPDPDDVDPRADLPREPQPERAQVRHGRAWSRAVAGAAPGTRYQFERLGYFCVDRDSAPGKPVFNRTVTLRDTWAKIEKRGGNG